MNIFIKKCSENPLYKHALFLALTAFILLTYGYYFGTFDQASHIPFLKKTVDNSLFPNDHFFDLSKAHYSYFWLFFVPFYKIGLLEVSMFIVHIFTTYLTFLALWNLSKVLFHNTFTSILVVVTAAFPHIGFSGFPLFEFSMLNRTVALPFEIIAITWYLKKNYRATFLLLGFLYNFHALSVHFILGMIGIDLIFVLMKKRDYVAFRSLPLFFLTAFPVLYWKFSHSGGIPFVANWEWFQILNLSTFYHLFNFMSSSFPIVNLLTLGGIATIILFYFAKRNCEKSDLHETISHFFIGGIIVLIIQQLATSFYPATIIIQAQIVRIGLFLSLFSYIYMAHMISLHSRNKYHLIYFMIALCLSFSPLFLLVSLLFWRVKNKVTLTILTFSSIALFGAILYSLISTGLARPGIYIWPRKTPYYEVQVWAKNNTEKSARFIIPPALWGLYEIEWRVGSERSAVSTLSELLEGAFDPSYITYWKPRFEESAPGALKQFHGNTFTNFITANRAYYTHSTEKFKKIGKKYNAQYLVVQKKYKHKLPIVYENSEYVVYSIK